MKSGQKAHKSADNADRRDHHSSSSSSSFSRCYPIGKWELALYFGVWISHSAMAFWLCANASQKVGHWLDHWLEPSGYVHTLVMDNSDVELKLFRGSLPKVLLAFAIHSIVFRLSLHFLPNKRVRSTVLILFWLAIQIYLASFQCLCLILLITFSVLAITVWSRTHLLSWPIVILLICSVHLWAPFSRDPSKYYREFNLYLYSTVKIINLSTFLAKDGSNGKISRDLALQFLAYLLYPPFSTALIVLFEDFQRQSEQVVSSRIDQQKIKLFAWRFVRLIFWLFVLDFFLHICRANAFFNSPFTLLNHFNNYEVSSIAYVAGQLFHVKYVLIFGFPALFASIDGFHPPGLPICISRISKYSQMWRYFDRGLYAFLKNQVYIPLIKSANCNPSSSGSALGFHQIGPMLSVFFFVLLWHGMSSNYLWWVCLSALELCIERVGRELIWPNQFFQRKIYRQLSEANFLRLKAACMLFTVIPGIFGVFFFLGRVGSVGSHIFRTVLLEGLFDIFTLQIRFLNPGFVFSHLMLIGYCFNHVCLFIETKLEDTAGKTRAKRE